MKRAISQVPSDLALSCRDFYGALSVSEWRAGLHRAAARRAVSHGCTGVSAKGISYWRGVVSSFALDQSWGLGRGLIFMMTCFLAMLTRTASWGWSNGRLGRVSITRIAWLKKASGKPFFFWLHLYDAHSPYSPPEPFKTQYADRPYDGEIAYMDHELGRLFAWLKARQLYDNTVILVVSDHGESLGEHGEREHGFFVYNSTVHIPLIVKPQKGSGIRPGRVARPVETTAIAPTLLAMAGIKDAELEKQFQSMSLFAPAGAGDAAAYSETFYPTNAFGWSPLHAIETSRYHYIDAPTPELYDLTADPSETKNIASEQKGNSVGSQGKVDRGDAKESLCAIDRGRGGLVSGCGRKVAGAWLRVVSAAGI